jgi:hypothetical protein
MKKFDLTDHGKPVTCSNSIGRQAVPEAPALPIYQARQEQSWAWTDVSRDVYEFVESKFRRIVYASTGAAPEAPACSHVWNDFGQLGGRNVSWCPRCDTLAWTGKEPASATQQAGAAFENPGHKDCYCGGWTDDTGDYHNLECPELATPAATTASASDERCACGSHSAEVCARAGLCGPGFKMGWGAVDYGRAAPSQEAAPLPKQGEAHALAVAANFDVQYDAPRGVHHYHGVIENIESLIERAAQAPHAGADAERLDFMDGPDFVSLHQYISHDKMFIEVQRENPDGNYRGDTAREAIDAAMSAATNQEPK